MYCLIVGTETWPQVTLAWKLWGCGYKWPLLSSTCLCLRLFTLKKAWVIKSTWQSFCFLLCQTWPLLSVKSWALKGECLCGENGGSRGLEDEAVPWLFWVLALVDQQWTRATIKANLLLRMNDLDWWSGLNWVAVNIISPGRWRLEMGFSGHFLALLFSVLNGNRHFGETRKDLLTSFENKVLSASWRTRVSTGVYFHHFEYLISLHLSFDYFLHTVMTIY